MNVAIIPARGGSKRIPRKNIREFCAQPMIAWSINAARQSGCFDRVVVSTDDAQIAEVAVAYGAEVPFVRPDSLSDDHTGTIPVIKHAIESLSQQQPPPQLVCCLYATAPFVRPEDLQRGLTQLNLTGASYAFSVTSYAFPVQRALKMTENDRVEMLYPDYFNVRSQDLGETWHDAGQFYWGRTQAWLNETILFGPESTPVKLPRYRVQDIDTMEDWERAEWLFKAMQQ